MATSDSLTLHCSHNAECIVCTRCIWCAHNEDEDADCNRRFHYDDYPRAWWNVVITEDERGTSP